MITITTDLESLPASTILFRDILLISSQINLQMHDATVSKSRTAAGDRLPENIKPNIAQ